MEAKVSTEMKSCLNCGGKINRRPQAIYCSSRCSCRFNNRLYARRKRAENPVECQKKQNMWRAENKERVCAQSRARRKANPLKVKEGKKRWEQKNIERHRAGVRKRSKKWALLNPWNGNAKRARYVSAKKSSFPKWAIDEIKQINRLYEDAVRMTKETGIPHEVDHVVPLQGRFVCGLHTLANLRIIPMMDNRMKGNRMLEDVA